MGMTKYLDGILTEENRKYGFTLSELTDDFLFLCKDGEIKARFSQFTTAIEINNEADKIRMSE